MTALRRWFDDLPLQVKTVFAFGSLIALIVVVSAAFFFVQDRQQAAREWTQHTYRVLIEVDGLKIAALQQRNIQRGFVITGEPKFREGFEEAGTDFDAHLRRAFELMRDNPIQQSRLDLVADTMQEWRTQVATRILALAADPATRSQAAELIRQGASSRYMDKIAADLDTIGDTEEALLRERETQLDDTIFLARIVIGVSLLLGLLAGVFASRQLRRLIVRPIVEMTALMTRLVGKDHSIEVSGLARRDEIGAIARAVQSFKELAIDMDARDWIKANSARLSERLQKAATTADFANELAAGIAPLLGCGFVVMYRVEHEDTLVPAGGYGFERESLGRLQFRVGSGLVGECARQRRAVAVSEVPEKYARIQSGLGSAPPRHLLLLPILAGERLAGVLELASFAEFPERQRRFLDELLPIVALSFENLQRALHTRHLLEESQIQAEELQASEETLRVQQEELRATNEALHAKGQQLEQQAAKLQASEEELRLQSEELRASNEQLAEKGATLERQKGRLEALQQETQDKADELARASRYKSEFLANMSHELRTPLNSLLILSRSLADNEAGHLDAEEIESAQVIHDSGTKLLQLINDILDLSKVEAGKMDLVHGDLALADFVGTLRRNFRHVAAGRGLSFDIELAPGLPDTIRTDAARLEQVANNLLGNAFKFTKTGGVRLRIARPDADLPLPPGLEPATTLAIAVTDTGIGIAPDKQPRMFQAFEQADAGTSRQYGGTGLGLSISRALAQLLGGDIVMRSEAGVGSTFTVLLPEQPPAVAPVAVPTIEPVPAPAPALAAAPSAAPAAPPTAVVSPAPAIADDRELLQPGDTVILIVEDDPAFARILADLIRRKGYRVLAAGDGETGLALARRHAPSGVLLDVNLPGMDGWAVLDRMKSDPGLARIPVHFISADDDSLRALEAGAIGFLTKPVTKSALLLAFDRLLQQAPQNLQRVLLVDDDETSRAAMHRLLEEVGVELVDATSAADALARMAATRFDCIVLDLGVHGLSGQEFLERASALGPLPPVVIHSAHELSRDEGLKLRQYTDSIVIKGARSPERLLDEVSLFLHSIRPAASSSPPPREVDDSLDGRTVLVVDDDMRNVFALSKALRAKGLKVLMAQDGHKALKQLDDNDGIELVLMDIMMPGLDGYDTMREIRRQPRHAQLPIIALTAKAMRGDREKCLEAGANDYLSKPIDIDKLLSMMRVWLRPRA